MKVYSPWCCPSGNFVFTFVLGAREAGVSKDGHGRDRSGGILRDAVLRTAPQSLTHNNAREIGGSDALACGGKGFQPAQSPRLIESSQASTAGRLAGALRFKPLKRLVFIFGQALRSALLSACEGCARLEGRPQARSCRWPSFETAAHRNRLLPISTL